jgi:hypothetical protein
VRISLPISDGLKLDAGSYITVDGTKVYPTSSVPVDGFVSFDYKNHYEKTIGRDKGELLKIRFAEENTLPVEIKVFANTASNTEAKALNFGPLGAKKSKEGTKIRFGTVWYFDDFAATQTWTRGDGMGTYILQLKNILNVKNDTNDFYVYLKNTYPNTYSTIISTFENSIENKIISDDGVSHILPYLKEFIADWNGKGKTEKMSFGGAEAISETAYYYYKQDENGRIFMEYSAVLEIPQGMEDRQLVYIPYVSYVKNYIPGTWIPDRGEGEPDVYLYRAPEKVYRYKDLA